MLGNNIRAREEARTAVSMEPNNYAYQNLLDQLQSPGQSYTSYQQPYAQPSGNPGRFCLSFWMYLVVCNICNQSGHKSDACPNRAPFVVCSIKHCNGTQRGKSWPWFRSSPARPE